MLQGQVFQKEVLLKARSKPKPVKENKESACISRMQCGTRPDTYAAAKLLIK